MVKEDEEAKEYLPDWSPKHIPDKTYLCNILNTVHHNSIVNWIKQVKQEKIEEKQKQQEHYVLIDDATLKDLLEFNSLY